MEKSNMVRGYLKGYGTEKLIEVGQLLGLDRSELKLSDKKELLGDLIDSWLRREGRVVEESGDPTWRSLAKALLEAGLTGTSLDIQKDFNFTLN
jgi:hypothetical protein